MAAAFAYTAKLPMYVFHSEAGVFGKTRFEDTPAIDQFRHLKDLLPADLPNWTRHDGKKPEAPFTVLAAGQPNRYWPEVPASRDGCVRNIGSRKGDRFICVPIGIRPGGLQLEAREELQFEVFDPLTGLSVQTAKMKPGERVILPARSGGLILKGQALRRAKGRHLEAHILEASYPAGFRTPVRVDRGPPPRRARPGGSVIPASRDSMPRRG
jgi:hypothetical protein